MESVDITLLLLVRNRPENPFFRRRRRFPGFSEDDTEDRRDVAVPKTVSEEVCLSMTMKRNTASEATSKGVASEVMSKRVANEASEERSDEQGGCERSERKVC